MGLLLLVLLILFLVGGLPNWGYSRNWGYGPSGILSLLVIIFICLMLFDVVHWRTMNINY